MDLFAIALLAAAIGVDSGWQPASAAELPRRHTVRFQNDDGWSGDRYAPTTTNGNRQYDQRGATIGVEPIRTAQNSPWSLDGASQAAADAGNSLRSAVESGIQQANQQLSQVGQQTLDRTQSATRDFGQQLQGMTGLGNPTSPPPTLATQSPSTWPAPPPPAASRGATTPETWTSIRPELAPPRLPTPQLAASPRTASNPWSTGNGGPTFPSANDRAASQHSVLAPPPLTRANQSSPPNWASDWGSATTTRSNSGDNDAAVGLVPVPPRARTTPPSTQPQTANDPDAARWAWPTAGEVTSNPTPPVAGTDDRYRQPTETAPAADNAADIWANFGSAPGNSSNSTELDRYSTQPQLPMESVPSTQPAAEPIAGTQATIGVAPQASQSAASSAPAPGEPWKPLLATMLALALAGSLGANLFLGWSYADARHRYRALVAKTTHSFQQAAGLAA